MDPEAFMAVAAGVPARMQSGAQEAEYDLL